MFTLVPDFIFDTFDKVTVDFLIQHNIRAVVLDIDNTLEPYEHALPGEHVKKWLADLKSAGISAAFVSNNNKERVELFNKDLGLVAFYKAGKPFKKNVLRAIKMMGSDNKSTLLIGDQVFTDVWAARNAGVISVLVPPINDKKDPFTKFKRVLEKPIINRYNKKRGDRNA